MLQRKHLDTWITKKHAESDIIKLRKCGFFIIVAFCAVVFFLRWKKMQTTFRIILKTETLGTIWCREQAYYNKRNKILCKKQHGWKIPRLLVASINIQKEPRYNTRMNIGMQQLYFGWNVIKRRIWRLGRPLLNATELLSTGNLEKQQFLLGGTKVSFVKHTNPTAKMLPCDLCLYRSLPV